LTGLSDHGIKFTARTLFEQLSPFYDTVLDLATLLQDRYWKSWLIKEAGLGIGSKVLDLACGTCVLEESMCATGCQVIGLDLTQEMLQIGAKKHLPCLVALVAADAQRLPFRDRIFDAVVSCYLAKYCDLETLLSQVERSLRDGGRLVLYDFSRPRGLLGVFYAFYLYGVLRLVGWVLGHASPGLAFTFTNLPAIITVRRWDDGLVEKLAGHGFVTIRKTRLSGGVVTAMSASFTA
jgi:demethylmenaquinone methyltransferase/2-methoxy-6-polyprenyl-1,4-benzoquinol methylase